MATVTALLTAQAVGTGANRGTGLYAAKVTLDSATAGVVVSGQLINGAGAPCDQKQRIRVFFTTSPFDVSAGIPHQFENDAQCLELNISHLASATKTTTSEFVINQGGFFYYWLEVPLVGVVGSLNLNLVEI